MTAIPSNNFSQKRVSAEQDGIVEMPEISRMRKIAIAHIDKSENALAQTQCYADEFNALAGVPKNKAAGRFLETIREEFGNRVHAEKLATKLEAFFSAHADRLPAELRKHFDVEALKDWRISAGGGQGTGHRELSFDFPLKERGTAHGATRALLQWMTEQPELAGVASELKSGQWGAAQLFTRSSLHKDVLGWSTEDVPDAFRQIQLASSDGKEKITREELGDVIQVLANLDILDQYANRTQPDDADWLQAKKDFVQEYAKAKAAGHTTAASDTQFAFLADLYKMS